MWGGGVGRVSQGGHDGAAGRRGAPGAGGQFCSVAAVQGGSPSGSFPVLGGHMNEPLRGVPHAFARWIPLKRWADRKWPRTAGYTQFAWSLPHSDGCQTTWLASRSIRAPSRLIERAPARCAGRACAGGPDRCRPGLAEWAHLALCLRGWGAVSTEFEIPGKTHSEGWPREFGSPGRIL